MIYFNPGKLLESRASGKPCLPLEQSNSTENHPLFPAPSRGGQTVLELFLIQTSGQA